MADSNSKKPMALLLLVVVAVLVVIMVSGGDAEFAGHDKLDSKEACEGAKGTWAKVMVAVEGWDGEEATCTDATFTKAVVDDATTADVNETAAATCMKEAEKETCAAPDWATLTAEADCTAANGSFKAAVADDTATADVDETAAATCEAWVAPAAN